MLPRLVLLASSLALSGCAVLHHVQLSDIDNRPGQSRRKVSVKVSETGINLDEAQKVIRQVGGSKAGDSARTVQQILSTFQMGPRTGNVVFVATYARQLGELLWDQCPSGKLINILSVREMMKYPVISGEIVRIDADCITP